MHCTVFDNLLLSCCPLRYSLRFGSRYHHHYIPDDNFIHCHFCFACEVVLEFGADFLILRFRRECSRTHAPSIAGVHNLCHNPLESTDCHFNFDLLLFSQFRQVLHACHILSISSALLPCPSANQFVDAIVP